MSVSVQIMVAHDHQEHYEGVHVHGFGYRMLSKMGWAKGKGLGSKEDGMASHVKVEKKFDTFGIGAKYQVDWSASTNSYNDVLARLNMAFANKPTAASNDGSESEVDRKSKRSKKIKKKKQEEEVDSDAEAVVETKKKKKSKKKKRSTVSETDESDVTTSAKRKKSTKMEEQSKKKKHSSKGDAQSESESEARGSKEKKRKRKAKLESASDMEEEGEAETKERKKKKRTRKSTEATDDERDGGEAAESSGENTTNLDEHRAISLNRFSFRKKMRAKNVAHYSKKDLSNILYHAHDEDHSKAQDDGIESDRKPEKKKSRKSKSERGAESPVAGETSKQQKEDKHGKGKKSDAHGKGKKSDAHRFIALPASWKPEPLRSDFLKRVFVACKGDDHDEKGEGVPDKIKALDKGDGFTEAQQEAIAVAAQKAKIEGKKGLGFGVAKTELKVGHDFVGKKVKFD